MKCLGGDRSTQKHQCWGKSFKSYKTNISHRHNLHHCHEGTFNKIIFCFWEKLYFRLNTSRSFLFPGNVWDRSRVVDTILKMWYMNITINISTWIHNDIATQALQFDMDLECKIEAYPPPAIRWPIEHQSLSSADNHQPVVGNHPPPNHNSFQIRL